MSRNGNLFALALGLGGGALAWHATRDSQRTPSTGAGGPPRTTAPCVLKLDVSGLTADGVIVDVPGAVARCRPQARGDLLVTSSAPAATLAQLTAAMQAAGVTLTQRVV